jgi:hypothetical protein
LEEAAWSYSVFSSSKILGASSNQLHFLEREVEADLLWFVVFATNQDCQTEEDKSCAHALHTAFSLDFSAQCILKWFDPNWRLNMIFQL